MAMECSNVRLCLMAIEIKFDVLIALRCDFLPFEQHPATNRPPGFGSQAEILTRELRARPCRYTMRRQNKLKWKK